jgi:uncharacterized protein YydD (DUF2326 family)
MLLKTYIQRLRKILKDIKDEVLISKYTKLVTRLIECMEEESWAFSEAAEYLMFSKKEYFDCIGILRLKRTGTVEEAVRAYIVKKEEA